MASVGLRILPATVRGIQTRNMTRTIVPIKTLLRRTPETPTGSPLVLPLRLAETGGLSTSTGTCIHMGCQPHRPSPLACISASAVAVGTLEAVGCRRRGRERSIPCQPHLARWQPQRHFHSSYLASFLVAATTGLSCQPHENHICSLSQFGWQPDLAGRQACHASGIIDNRFHRCNAAPCQ